MFTGIIEAQGIVTELRQSSQQCRLSIQSKELDFSDVHLGDSIAVNGVCLTVVSFDTQSFCADVSHETLKLTSLGFLKIGSKVNLEKAMLVGSRFGGHIVSGHVDGLATVESITRNGNASDFWIEAPQDLARYIAHKGSITVDGISLTVNEVNNSGFRLTIIPHTELKTSIGDWKVGTQVNLEVDVIARYTERLLSSANHSASDSNLNREFLAEHGFLR
ncbi:riboflavin synthase [Alginatibacterium sediminis]|uniref:Riboflavin synthase n=1 Tax=Alginatibacterium sediminis TaxID=2164068 RepID=A0A420ECV7_9ALTE|nr:riboflavin synthase [Alginatibacterium sediminis]RKF18569.1 riboflavin synthase [Alginatibacterium sediminis]